MIKKDQQLMLASGKLILRGKRWRKFHEFTAVPIFVSLATITGAFLRISKVGIVEWQLTLFVLVPVLFLVWWIPYKNKQLRFFEIPTQYDKHENYSLAAGALQQLNWPVEKDDKTLIEAVIHRNTGLTWGNDMIFILIDDHRILVTSLSNLDMVKNQAFFTFGQLRRNVNEFTLTVNEILNTAVDKRLAAKG